MGKICKAIILLAGILIASYSFSEDEVNAKNKEANDELLFFQSIFECLGKLEEVKSHTEEQNKLLADMERLDEQYSSLIKEKLFSMKKLPEKKFISYDAICDGKSRSEQYISSKKEILTLYWRFEEEHKITCIYINTYPVKPAIAVREIQEPFLMRVAVMDKKDRTIRCSILPYPFSNKKFPDWPQNNNNNPFFLGVAKNPESIFPDIFVLYGPDGSGCFGHIFRCKYSSETKKWEPTLIEYGKITSRDYSIDRGKLIFASPYKTINLLIQKYTL